MRIKSKKKLALLVGMALTVGSTLAVNPMDAYAATRVTWDAGNNKYVVTVGETSEPVDKASAAIDKIIEVADKDITIDLRDETWQKDENSKNAAAALVAAFKDKEVILKENVKVYLNFLKAGAYTITNGDSGSTVKLANSVFEVHGNIAELIAQPSANRTAKINVAEGKTVGTITVNDGTAVALKLSGTGTVNKLDAKGDITVSATGTKLTEIAVAEGKTLNTTGAVTAGSITGNGNVIAGDALEVTGDINAASVTTTGALKADSVTTTGNLVVGGNLIAKEVTADSVTLKGTAANSDINGKITINANSVTLDATSGTAGNIAKMKLAPKNGSGTVNVKVVTTNGALDEGTRKAITDAAGGADKVNIGVTSEEAETAKSTADAAIAKADEELGKVNEFAAKDAAEIAKANPFTTKLPSASDIATIANPSTDKLDAVKATATALESAITTLDTEIGKAEGNGNTKLKAELENKKAELQSKLNNVSSAKGMQAKAAELTAAVQQAGKTAAAPGVASARTATVVTNVMTANVTGRTSELRGFASAVDEGRPAPDNVWFQYKHTNMDVDNGDVYGKSTVKTNNYQLGYDAKVGPNDYLGAYIGTTTGNVEFNAPAVTDRTDIDNAYDFGIYGTHMLPSDQYIDYMIHTGKFDSKYNGVTWGTKDTGAMIGYGAKIAQNDRLTWNPYIQLAYDKVSVDSYMAGANYIASDDSNNWTAKLGINLLDVSGFYGGLAYSRGLSGSYNAYINGVPMPSQDNNANVLYMSLGYRANMSRNVFLDLNMEKTFADYNGWTAAGKVNFYF